LIWISIPFSIACLDWLALARGWVRIDYLAKPGAMLTLIAWLWLYVQPNPGTLAVWISIGLIFSLIGDVLLMLPHEQFIGGLIAFFISHLVYILALNPTFPPLNGPVLALALVVSILWWVVIRPIRTGLFSSNKEKLVPPILAYTLVISLMMLSAWITVLRDGWPLLAAVLIASGATSFFLSDLLLAWNRFVRPIRSARFYVRILYHLGQIALTAGAALAAPFI
jgi:uncharacterized membrane protein YhhN